MTATSCNILLSLFLRLRFSFVICFQEVKIICRLDHALQLLVREGLGIIIHLHLPLLLPHGLQLQLYLLRIDSLHVFVVLAC